MKKDGEVVKSVPEYLKNGIRRDFIIKNVTIPFMEKSSRVGTYEVLSVPWLFAGDSVFCELACQILPLNVASQRTLRVYVIFACVSCVNRTLTLEKGNLESLTFLYVCNTSL